MSAVTLIADVRGYLEKSLKDSRFIVVAYLFGSCAKGEAGKESDLDLAFLLDEKAYRSNRLAVLSKAYTTAGRMGMAFERKVDVTILNASSLEMAYEVVTTGCCVYELDVDRRMDYEVAIRGMYFDFRPFLEELRSRSLARL